MHASHEAGRKRAAALPCARQGSRSRSEGTRPAPALSVHQNQEAKWLAVDCWGCSAFHPIWLIWVLGGCTRSYAPGIMKAIWQVLATGMGVVMIATTIAVIIGCAFALVDANRIDDVTRPGVGRAPVGRVLALGGGRMTAMKEHGQLLARVLAGRSYCRLEQIVLYVRGQLAPNLGGCLSKSGRELVRSHSITSSAGGRTIVDYHRFSGGSASSTP